MSGKVDALSIHRLCLRAAQAGALLFTWIFIFEYFSRFYTPSEAALYTVGVFSIAYLVSFLLTPFSARAVRNGVKLFTTKAIVALLVSYLVLGASLYGIAISPLVGILFFAIFFGIYRSLYRISYQAHMGRNGGLWLADTFVAFMPVVFGYIAAFSNHPALIFVPAAFLVLVSLVPHLRIPDVVERYPWSVLQTFLEFTKPLHRRLVTRAFFDGVHAATLFLLWPLAVFLLLDRSYALLGIVFSLTLLSVLLARYVVRRFFSRSEVFSTPTVRAAHFISAWVFRLVSASPLAIIAVGVYAHVGSGSRDEVDVFALEHTADQGVYLDEHSVLKEMGAAIGKIVAAIFFGTLALYASIPVAFAITFILVAVFSGVMFLFSRRSVVL